MHTIFRDVQLFRNRWVQCLHNKLGSSIAEAVHPRPVITPIRAHPTVQELTDVTPLLPNSKAIEPGRISIKMFKIARHGDPALWQRVLDSDHRHLNGEEIPQKWKQATMKVLYDKRVKTESGDYVGVSL